MTEILICGCTELFTEDALLRLAEEYRVVIAGPSAVSGNQKHITAYKTSPTEEKFRQLFDVYSFTNHLLCERVYRRGKWSLWRNTAAGAGYAGMQPFAG